MLLFDKYGISTAETWINAGKDENEKIMRRCIRHPLYFVENILGINHKNGYKVSNQQKDLLEAVGALTYAKKIIWDAKTLKEKEAIRKDTKIIAKKLGISVRSGKGAGKSGCSAWLIYWFLSTHGDSKICVTGPTQDSISKILWSELHRWYNATDKNGEYLFKEPYRGMIELRADTVRVIEKGKASGNWLAYQRVSSRSADDAVAIGTLSGLHAPNVMVIADEAAAISDLVFQPLESTLTGRCNFALLLFNPTRSTGYAYDSHYSPKISPYFIPLHWNTEQSDLVSKEYIETLREKYGRDSNEYRVSVLGECPLASDNALIPYVWIEQAIDKKINQVTKPLKLLGIDVGNGGDSTIACYREGLILHWFKKIHTTDIVEQSLEIKKIVFENGIDQVFIDNIGVGAGISSLLRGERDFTTRGICVSNKASSSEYRILRDQLWWNVRDWFSTQLVSIPNHEEFRIEVSTIKSDKIGGKLVVEGKDSIRKRLGRSCDYADSFLMTMVVKDWDTKGKIDILTAQNRPDYDPTPVKKRYSWMGI